MLHTVDYSKLHNEINLADVLSQIYRREKFFYFSKDLYPEIINKLGYISYGDVSNEYFTLDRCKIVDIDKYYIYCSAKLYKKDAPLNNLIPRITSTIKCLTLRYKTNNIKVIGNPYKIWEQFKLLHMILNSQHNRLYYLDGPGSF